MRHRLILLGGQSLTVPERFRELASGRIRSEGRRKLQGPQQEAVANNEKREVRCNTF